MSSSPPDTNVSAVTHAPLHNQTCTAAQQHTGDTAPFLKVCIHEAPLWPSSHLLLKCTNTIFSLGGGSSLSTVLLQAVKTQLGLLCDCRHEMSNN